MLSCPELLSPAGSLEALKYAVMYGADAVYCALPRFGMRAAPVNLTIGELHDGCIFAHARGKKVYLTLNNLPTNDELSELPQYIKDAAEAGVDAFIIADLGVLSLPNSMLRMWMCIFLPRQASPIMLLQPWPTTWAPSVWCWRAS